MTIENLIDFMKANCVSENSDGPDGDMPRLTGLSSWDGRPYSAVAGSAWGSGSGDGEGNTGAGLGNWSELTFTQERRRRRRPK